MKKNVGLIKFYLHNRTITKTVLSELFMINTLEKLTISECEVEEFISRNVNDLVPVQFQNIRGMSRRNLPLHSSRIKKC